MRKLGEILDRAEERKFRKQGKSMGYSEYRVESAAQPEGDPELEDDGMADESGDED